MYYYYYYYCSRKAICSCYQFFECFVKTQAIITKLGIDFCGHICHRSTKPDFKNFATGKFIGLSIHQNEPGELSERPYRDDSTTNIGTDIIILFLLSLSLCQTVYLQNGFSPKRCIL